MSSLFECASSGVSLSTCFQGSDRYSSQFENNLFIEMCSGAEAVSCLRLIDFVHHATLGVRVKKKKNKFQGSGLRLTV